MEKRHLFTAVNMPFKGRSINSNLIRNSTRTGRISDVNPRSFSSINLPKKIRTHSRNSRQNRFSFLLKSVPIVPSVQDPWLKNPDPSVTAGLIECECHLEFPALHCCSYNLCFLPPKFMNYKISHRAASLSPSLTLAIDAK